MSDLIVRCPFAPNELEIPALDITSTLYDGLLRNPSQLAIKDVSTGREVSRDDFVKVADLISRRLISHRCGRGDVVAIFSPNSIEWILFGAATFRIGAVLAAINSLLTSDELRYQLNLCGAKFLYTVPGLVSIVHAIAKEVKIQKIFLGEDRDGCINIFRNLSNDSSTLPPLPLLTELKLKPQDVANIMFSSGTTGPQKAVMLSHRNLQAAFRIYGHKPTSYFLPKQLIFTPFSHNSGFQAAFLGLASGSSLYILPRFDLHVYLKAIVQHQIASLVVVPTVATLLVKSEEVLKYNIKLKQIFVGAAPVSKELEDLLIQRFPGLQIRQVYGMTETTKIVTVVPEDEEGVTSRRRPGTVGVPLHNIEIKVVDDQSGAALGPNCRGEICSRSPFNMLGYANNPEATAATIDADGWVHSGDIGYYDEDGYFYVVDRLKELIKYNAYQVAPAELEAVLLSHPHVADAGVAGIPDPDHGEVPMAWVVRKPGATISETDIDNYVRGKAAPYKWLRGGVRFVASIPRNLSGKILRREMKKAGLRGKL